MTMNWCPHGPQWEELKAKIGPVEGMRACMAENRIPDASEFPKGGKYSDIVLQPYKVVDYSHIQEFGERYRAIADKKTELQAQGYQITGLDATGFMYIMPENKNYQKENITKQPISELDKVVTGFLTSVGANIEHIADTGQSWIAVADTVNGIIQVVNGKANINTLGHEATHMFLDLLDDDSKLLRDIVKDVVNRDEYDRIYDQYKNDPQYQKDGKPDEYKLAKEAAAHIIDKVIVQQYKDKKAMKWWDRLWNYIKSLFMGKSLDIYQQVASDILENNTEKLSPEKIAAIQQANSRGELYYQMSEKDKKFNEEQLKGATQEQKDVIEKVINPENRVVLDEGTHIYTDLQGNVYNSTTRMISGEFSEEKQAKYEANRLWGNDFDNLLRGAITRTPLSQIITQTIDSDMKELIYHDMSVFVGQMTVDGSIALTQVVVATPYSTDPAQRVAGSIDLLLVDREGKMTVVDLKTSVNKALNAGGKASSTYTSIWRQNTGSVFNNLAEIQGKLVPIQEGQKPVELSKEMQHGIQVGSYSKMLGLAGHVVKDQWSKHIYIEATGDKIKNYEDEGLHHIPLDNNKMYIDAVIPGTVEYRDPIDQTNPLRQNIPTVEEEEHDMEDYQATLQERVAELYQATTQWRDRLKELKEGTEFDPAGSKVADVDKLLAAIYDEVANNADYSKAYTIFLQSARANLQNILKFITDKKDNKLVNADNPRFLWVLSRAMEYINAYKPLFHTEEFATKVQDKMYKDVDKLLRDVGQAIISANQYTADKNIYDWSVNKAIKGVIEKSVFNDRGVYQSELTRMQDIGEVQKMMGSLGGNTILDITQKQMTDVQEKAREQTEQTLEDVERVANNLVSAGVTDYKFMYKLDKNGKWTGKIVTAIGDTYRELRKKVDEPLYDNNTGVSKQYIPVNDSNGNKEHIEWNKALWELKRARTEFMNAEDMYLDADGEVVIEDGKYHRYSDEFKVDRSIYMRPVVDKYGNSKWVFKSVRQITADMKAKLEAAYKDLTLEQAWQRECVRWRDKNYNYNEYITTIVDKEGNPTGVTKEVTGDKAWFPMQEHIRVREIASDGTHLTDEQYRKLMNPKTSAEIAQSEYYKMYTRVMGKEVSKLPSEYQYWLEQGNVPTLEGNVMQLMGQEGADKATILMRYLKPQWVPKGYLANKDVLSKREIPVGMKAGVQDTEKLESLKKELRVLIDNKDNISADIYQKRDTELREKIRIEENKIKAEQLHPDLTAGLKAFVGMTEQFHAMSGIEDVLLNIQQKIASTQFEQKVGLKGKRTVQGEQSRTYERFQWFLDNEFYHDSTYTQSMAEYISKKLMNITSASAIAFNVTGMINNTFIASLNNRLETIGGDYFDSKEYKRTVKEFHTEFLPGYVKSLGMKKPKYGEKIAGSKYEAIVRDLNMIKHAHDENNGKVSWLGKMWGYMGYEGGEYMVQSETGIAITKTVKVRDSKGNEVSLYDAYEWNPNTGKVELQKGITNLDGTPFTDTDKHSITHRIWKTNERIHGNYRWKVMLEKYVAGRLALQFHKWVYPNAIQRFNSLHFDEALGGGMDIEGRYTTLGRFLKSITELKSATQAWNILSKLQRNNLKKDLADAVYISVLIAAGYIVKRLASGLDPEDDPYLKKFTNYLQYQADRGVTELSIFIPVWGAIESYKLVENPFAVTSSLHKFQKLLVDVSAYPFRDDEQRVYQRGPFKEQSKVVHDIRDIVPLLREINQYYLLDSKTNFYIP